MRFGISHAFTRFVCGWFSHPMTDRRVFHAGVGVKGGVREVKTWRECQCGERSTTPTITRALNPYPPVQPGSR